jgi:hypothetical protein
MFVRVVNRVVNRGGHSGGWQWSKRRLVVVGVAFDVC